MRRLVSIGAALLLAALPLAADGAGHPQARAAGDTGTLIYGSTTEPDTLNPETMVLVSSFEVTSAVFDSLLTPDPSNRLRPNLATSVDHTPDGRTWTFHLRRGVQWADGVPFSSADVAYTYRALLNPKNNIVSKLGWDKIDRLTTPDPYTVVCHLSQVYAPFLSTVSYVNFIVPRHIYDRPGLDFNRAAFNRKPFGTGPYMVSEWKAGDQITLLPNPHSWRGQPHFKKIIYKIVPNANTQLVQLRTGDLDFGTVDQSQAKEARAIAGKRLDVAVSNAWLHIDLKQYGFLREQVVRQALDFATPKAAILKGILGGLGQIANGDISPIFADYYNSTVPQRPYDPAKAAALLAADGFSKGSDGVLRKGGQPFAMELWSTSGVTLNERINSVLKNVWGRLGVQVTLRSQSSTAIYGANGPQFSKQMTGITYAWYNYNDPDDTLFWNSSQIPTSPTGGGQNVICYFNTFAFQRQIDDLTNAGVATVDTAKRRAIYFKIQALLADQVPVIFLDWQPSLIVVPTTLAGFRSNPFNNLFWNVTDWRRA